MLIDAFLTPAYDDKFRRVFEFEQYADLVNYWIELDYYICRDKFASRLGRELSTSMLSFGGREIFADAIDKATIAAREYKLIKETVTPQTDFEDIYKVTELYGYAPSSTFTRRTSEVMRRPGVEDPAGYLNQSLTKSAGLCSWDQSLGRFTFNVGTVIAAKFFVGDTVKFFGALSGQWYNIVCPPVEVLAVDTVGGTITTATFGGVWDGSGAALSEQYIQWWLNDTLYWEGAKVPNSAAIIRDVTKRAASNVIAAVRNQISYHNTLPLLEDKFVVTNASGLELDTITSQTIPTISQWRAKVAAGEELIICEAEIDDTYAPYIYKKTVKYARCR